MKPWRMANDGLAEGWSTDRKGGDRLCLFLRRHGSKPDRKGGRHSGRSRIPNRVDISERPTVVETKERFGYREANAIMGKDRSGALASPVDRASKYTLLRQIGGKQAAAVV